MPSFPKKYDFRLVEDAVTSRWDGEGTAEKTIKPDDSRPQFTFLEGPPTANAPPGLHHVQSRFYKDLVCRYNYMKGFSVPRKGGWDCHGLPVEVQIEKKLGLKTKKEVLSYGIEKFNGLCREDVFTFIKDWDSMTKRMAFWIDLEKPYITMTNDYIESVWWSLKELYRKKLLYEDHKVVPYCPRCETPLSSHEVALGYKDVEEESITAMFKLKGEERYLLAWTTTPWTTPANIGLAVGRDIVYSVVEKDGKQFILARDALARHFKDPGIVEEFAGEKLVGREYEPLFDYYEGKLDQPAWKIIATDFVNTDEGTGIVHQAPAFGEEDYEALKKEGMAFVQPVNESGKFTKEVPDFEGKFVKDADPEIVRVLDSKGLLFDARKNSHSYPFCWRCDTPLLYYALKSWFVKVTAKKKRLIELNQQIAWHPDHVKDGRFGDWLDNVKDWALSRNKFWGTPLPIWECGSCDAKTAIGSMAELEAASDAKIGSLDLHKPAVDGVRIGCECGGKMSRVPYVIDTWYDSGAAPFAQLHYPFENKELFRKMFPYSFITEGVDQTRGWFYTLHVLGTLLFDGLSYRSCVVSGLVVDQNGEKMSKSKGNVLNPFEVFDTVGVDAVRLQFCSVSADVAKRFGYELVRENVTPFITTLWNVCVFAAEMDSSGDNLSDLRIEDRWIISRSSSLTKKFTEEFDANNYHRCFEEIKWFVVEDLSRWYVRLVRERQDDAVADSLAHVLDVLARLLAPFAPYLSDYLYRGLLEKKESVHLAGWPKPEATDADLEKNMDVAREITQAALSIREKIQRGVRWPVKAAFVVSRAIPRSAFESMKPLIQSQANLKELSLQAEFGEARQRLKPDYAKIGPLFGNATPAIIARLSMQSSEALARKLKAEGGVDVEVDGKKYALRQEHFTVSTELPEKYDAAEFSGGVVYVDKGLTDEMRSEGMARELVRLIQQSRKDAGLTKSDAVEIAVRLDAETAAKIKPFLDEAAMGRINASKFSLSESAPEGSGYEAAPAHEAKDLKAEIFIKK